MTTQQHSSEQGNGLEIAIIGMAGRFPGAGNVREFWQNIRAGVESISFFTDEQLRSAGVPESAFRDPHYVPARGILSEVDGFDAGFFGVFPREAEAMDPQHRLFLECAWEAMESAGYYGDGYDGLVGVFGGVGMNSYLLPLLTSRGRKFDPAEGYQLVIGNEKDFLATRVSYKLNLRGPGITVQTACSTSLVAVHMACQSLLGYQCDMAIAGGATISLPQTTGYLYQEGMILSPDGHCRAFDAKAQGTVAGNGVGVVVLKRLSEARADRDHIVAVIKASASNNDGSMRVGFTSPGVDGQADVIATAQALAGVDPETIRYIETHGTGTPLGDPIEITALTQVFRAQTSAQGFCAIGSLKTNVGHLDAAAGVAGLIKAALAVKHGEIPPSLHFDQPNPRIDFAGSPFYVNTALTPWEKGSEPRRAGVSSFGIGGTNAHVVLEEAPEVLSGPSKRQWQLVMLSAKTPTTLDTMTSDLATYLEENPGCELSDVAYTLAVGRKPFHHRRILACASVGDGATALGRRDPKRVLTASHPKDPVSPSTVFMFTGQGAQYIEMGKELYSSEPTFRTHVDTCAELLVPDLGLDIRTVIFPEAGGREAGEKLLTQTSMTQPALFVVEYAMARLLMHWGIQPSAMVGHSIGEYVAACLAEVMTVEEALHLVALRGRLMQSMPPGAMLSVPMEEKDTRPLLNERLSLAAVNAPGLCVVSGQEDAIEEMRTALADRGVDSRRLHTSHAFHSSMMDPVLEAFTAEVDRIELRPPKIPYLSNLTGTWITAAEAIDPNYWAKHLRHTVRFAENIRELMKESGNVFLEVGPGQTLVTLARRQPGATNRLILASMRHPQEPAPDTAVLLTALGRLWLGGAVINWKEFFAGERRKRLPLPTYPFERQRYWLDVQPSSHAQEQTGDMATRRTDRERWFYVPSWRRLDLPVGPPPHRSEEGEWLVFMDEHGLGAQLVREIKENGARVTMVTMGPSRAMLGERSTAINPGDRKDYDELVKELVDSGRVPTRILHLWGITPREPEEPGDEHFRIKQMLGFNSVLFLAQALARNAPSSQVALLVATSNVQEVIGNEELSPSKAMVLGPCRVIPQEMPTIRCRSVDLPPARDGRWESHLVGKLVREFDVQGAEAAVAYRGSHRWVQVFEPFAPGGADGLPTVLRDRGVYLITGGLGRIALRLAAYLGRSAHARLALIDRMEFPPREAWGEWVQTRTEQDPLVRKILVLRELEEAGAEVMVLQANLVREDEVGRVTAEVERRWGRIDGVVHTAGIVGEKAIRTIQETEPLDFEEQFQAKVHGLRVLQKVLSGHDPDFFLLFSSLASVLGGLGFAGYAASNIFLDALAAREHRRGRTRWLSINWDAWRFADDLDRARVLGGQFLEAALEPEEGVAAFGRLVGSDGPPQIAVSPLDLSARIAQWSGPADRGREPQESFSTGPGPSATHDRPNLQTAYVAPSTDLERQVVEVWQQLLGIGQIGIYDNFFDLGGNSLLGTQLASQLRGAFQVELPLRSLFEDPTVACVARIITGERSAREDTAGKIAEALKLVQGLSDEEVRSKLGDPAGSLLKPTDS